MKYYDRWLQIQKFALSLYESHRYEVSEDQCCKKILLVLLDFLRTSLTSQTHLDFDVLATERECSGWPCQCSSTLSSWGSEINEKIRELPKFGEIN